MIAVGVYGCLQKTAIEKAKHPVFSGTFIQILPNTHDHWTQGQWAKLFSHFEALGVHQLIIQWSAYNGQTSFPFEANAPALVSGLDTVLTLADQHNMQVYLGLNYDLAYWDRVGKTPQSVNNYLQHLGEKNVQLAQDLMHLSQSYRSFSGWYLTEEIDDINWNSPEKRAILIHYLQALIVQLHQLTPDKPVILSGFSNAALSPFKLTKLWHEIFSKTGLDIVLFQDGIGVNKLSLKQLPDYLAAVSWAARLNDKKFQIVIEVFKQISGTPINKKPFLAVAATPVRVKKQMQIAWVYSSELIAFSIPEYMTPDAGTEAQLLFENFRDQH
jgi:Domain of unknown function (DUF4434)